MFCLWPINYLSIPGVKSGCIHGNVACSFLCGIRRFHKYIQNQFKWVPVLHNVFLVKYKSRNCHNRYMLSLSWSGYQECTPVVGSLTLWNFNFTYFIIVHGAKLSCEVIDVHHRRSPLVQGSLEIPCKVVGVETMGKILCYCHWQLQKNFSLRLV